MTINRLLYDHQLAKLSAQHSSTTEDRDNHCDLAGHYAERIADWRRAKGLSLAGWPQDHRSDKGHRSDRDERL